MQSDKILELSSYITELKIDNDDKVIYIGVSFPVGWITSNLLNDLAGDIISYTQINGKENSFYLWTDIKNGYDDLLNVINKIVQINKENEHRVNLFSEKVNKLKEFFDDPSLTIEELQTIDFKIKRKKRSVKPIKQPTDINSENNGNINDGNN